MVIYQEGKLWSLKILALEDEGSMSFEIILKHADLIWEEERRKGIALESLFRTLKTGFILVALREGGNQQPSTLTEVLVCIKTGKLHCFGSCCWLENK